MENGELFIEEICKIVKDEMERDGVAGEWVHGLRHVERVWKNLELFLLHSDSTGSQMAKRLRAAVIFHDVKRGNPGRYKDHAKAGAAFFKKQTISGLDEEDMEAIAFAILHHNVGLEKLGFKKAESDRHILLQLLVLLDGMDSLCYVGYYRVLDWFFQKNRVVSLLGDIPAQTLRDILDGRYTDEEIENMHMKDNGMVLPHLVYDHQIFRQMRTPVEHLLPDEFVEEIERRIDKHRKEIDKMIKMKEKNERPLKLFKV